MLNKLQIIFTVILVSGCVSQPKLVEHKPSTEYGTAHFDANLNMWISGEYIVAKTGIEEISIYVKPLTIRANYAYPASPGNEIVKKGVADYFLIINSSENLNGLKMFDARFENFKVLESGRERIDGVGFYTKTILFNNLKFKKGDYYNLIDKAKYALPNCGILKTYYSSAMDLGISFIDSASCWGFMMEVHHLEYKGKLKDQLKEDFEKRLEKFKKYSIKSFGFVATKQLTSVSN